MNANDNTRATAPDDVIELGQASVATLGDVGIDEFEGGPATGGISND